MSQDDDQARRRLEIDWVRTLAGALAAVASAVVLSTLGAAGTLIGAAIGSVVATVGGAMFTQGISTSRQKLADAQSVALRKVGVAQAEVRRAERADDTLAHDSHLEHAHDQLAEAKQELDDAAVETAPGWRERLRVLPWKRIGLSSAALFIAVVATITVVELVAGRSVSSLTGGTDGGGTTIGKVARDSGGRGDGGGDEQQQEQPSEAPTAEPTGSGSPTPSDTATPSESPTESTDPTEGTDPTQTPTESATPSEEPSATPEG